MAEPTGQPAPAAVVDNPAPSPAPAAALTAASAVEKEYLTKDGKFGKDWREQIPEAERGRKTFDTIDDLPSALKLIANLDRQRGQQGKGVVKPGPDATPTELEFYRKAMGVPQAADGYKFEVPKEVEKYVPAEAMKPWQEVFHKAGLDPAQANLLGNRSEERRVGKEGR